MGNPGPVVSAQGFGAMGISVGYGPTDYAEARATLEHAFDLGITMFDTSSSYGSGHNEEFLAPFVAAHRADLVVATKFGIAHAPDGSPFVRNDAKYIRESVEGSLRRLQIDVIDLYYMHPRDPDVPIEDTVGIMASLAEAGKVRYLGLSEVTADELRTAHAVHPISAVQSEWSLFSRDIERFVVPAAVELGVAIVPYSPLGRGLLTGVTQQFAADDVRTTMTRFNNAEANHALLEPVRVIAQVHEVTVAQVALAWVQQRAAVWHTAVVPIPGTRSQARVTENVGAVGLALSDDELTSMEPIADRVIGARWENMSWLSAGRE